MSNSICGFNFAFLTFIYTQVEIGAMDQMATSALNDRIAAAAQFLSLTTSSTQSYRKASQVTVKPQIHV